MIMVIGQYGQINFILALYDRSALYDCWPRN